VESRESLGAFMHNTFITELFDWDGHEAGVRVINSLLHRARIPLRLRREMDFKTQMTTVEQRINLFHLLSQVLVFDVPGEVAEFGCFDGRTAVLYQKVIEHYAPTRQLHLYDNFKYRLGLRFDTKPALLENFQKTATRLPILHEGNIQETVPRDLPGAMCFVAIDVGYGGANKDEFKNLILHILEHIYPRLSPRGICVLADYCDPALVNAIAVEGGRVKMACDIFLKDKPEEMAVLWGNEYTHGYFRKK
jgi:O-methyltransferase